LRQKVHAHSEGSKILLSTLRQSRVAAHLPGTPENRGNRVICWSPTREKTALSDNAQRISGILSTSDSSLAFPEIVTNPSLYNFLMPEGLACAFLWPSYAPLEDRARLGVPGVGQIPRVRPLGTRRPAHLVVDGSLCEPGPSATDCPRDPGDARTSPRSCVASYRGAATGQTRATVRPNFPREHGRRPSPEEVCTTCCTSDPPRC